MRAASARAGAFLDRDGVLNELVPDPLTGAPESPLSVDRVRLLPGAAAAALQLARLGFALVCVTNQPAAAKGRVSIAQLLAVHDRVVALLREQGVTLAASRVCMHHEHGVVPALSGACDCRKPAPGMLLDAAGALAIDLRVSWMIGDTDADIAAGRAAGCRTLLIRHPGSVHKRFHAVTPDLVGDSLAAGTAALSRRMSETSASQ